MIQRHRLDRRYKPMWMGERLVKVGELPPGPRSGTMYKRVLVARRWHPGYWWHRVWLALEMWSYEQKLARLGK